MRKVEIFALVWDAACNEYTKQPIGVGDFHGWGFDYDGFEEGPGMYSVATVEREDGNVESVPVRMIRFIDKDEK